MEAVIGKAKSRMEMYQMASSKRLRAWCLRAAAEVPRVGRPAAAAVEAARC